MNEAATEPQPDILAAPRLAVVDSCHEGAAGMGRAAAGDIRFALLVPGLAAIWLGLSAIALFVSRTFHADAAWAKGLTCAPWRKRRVASTEVEVFRSRSSTWKSGW